MIRLTRLDGSALLVNEAHVVCVDCVGETLLTLTNGDRLRVQETPAQVLARVLAWQRRTAANAPGLGDLCRADDDVEEPAD